MKTLNLTNIIGSGFAHVISMGVFSAIEFVESIAAFAECFWDSITNRGILNKFKSTFMNKFNYNKFE